MPIHWSYKTLPELSALPATERKDVWKKAYSQAFEHWQTWLVLAVAYSLVAPVIAWLGSRFGYDLIGTMIGILIASAINERIVFRIARSFLKKTITRVQRGGYSARRDAACGRSSG